MKKLSIIPFSCLLNCVISSGHFCPVNKTIYQRPLPKIPLPAEAISMDSYGNDDVLSTPTQTTNITTSGIFSTFNGTKLKAILLRSAQLSKLWRVVLKDGEFVTGDGWELDMIQNLIKFLNFSINIRVETQFCIHETENEGCDRGIDDDIKQGRVDMVLGYMYIFENRLEYLTATHSFTKSRIQVMYLQPQYGAVRNVFSKPFHTDAWAILNAILLLVVFTGIIVSKVEKVTLHYEFNYSQVFSDIMAAILRQSRWVGQTFPLRAVILTLLTLFLLLWVFYCANFISILANRKLLVTSLSDLYEYHYDFVIQPGPLSSYIFNAATALGLRRLIRPSTPTSNPLPKKNETLWSTIKTSEVACVISYDEFIVLKFTQKISFEETCLMSTIVIGKIPTSHIYLKRRSPLLEGFNIGSLRVLNSGLVSHYTNRMKRLREIKCSSSPILDFANVEVYDLFVAYVILASGGLLAIIIALLEKLQVFISSAQHYS